MVKEFCICVAQRKDDRNFSWVRRGMGEEVEILRVEPVPTEEIGERDPVIDGDEWEYFIYCTGPEEAIEAVPGEGFIYPDSPLNQDGNPIPKPWNL